MGKDKVADELMGNVNNLVMMYIVLKFKESKNQRMYLSTWLTISLLYK